MPVWGPLSVILSVAASLALWAAAEVQKLEELKKKQKQLEELVNLKEQAKLAALKLQEDRLLRIHDWNEIATGFGSTAARLTNKRSSRQPNVVPAQLESGDMAKTPSCGIASEGSFVVVRTESLDTNKEKWAALPTTTQDPNSAMLEHDSSLSQANMDEFQGLSQTAFAPPCERNAAQQVDGQAPTATYGEFIPASTPVTSQTIDTQPSPDRLQEGTAVGLTPTAPTSSSHESPDGLVQALTLADLSAGQLCSRPGENAEMVLASTEHTVAMLQQELQLAYPRTQYSAPVGFKASTRRQLGHANKYAMTVQHSHKKRQVAGRKQDGQWLAERAVNSMALTRYRTHSSKDEFKERRLEAATSYGGINIAADLRQRAAANRRPPQWRADEWERVPVRGAEDLERVVVQALKDGRRVFHKQVVGDTTRFTWVAG